MAETRAAVAVALAEAGAAIEGAAAARPAAEQLDLLSAPAEDDGPGVGPLDAPLEWGAEGHGKVRRGPGRPAGSRNRRTEEMVALLLATRRAPLMAMADWWSVPVEELAQRLGCSKLDAAKLQLQALTAAAPYVHQRLPQAINLGATDADGNQMMPRLIVEFSGASTNSHDLDLTATEIVQNQALSNALAKQLDSAELDSCDQEIDFIDEYRSHPADLGSAR